VSEQLDASGYDRSRLLGVLVTHVAYLGGAGAGQTAKLLNNALLMLNRVAEPERGVAPAVEDDRHDRQASPLGEVRGDQPGGDVRRDLVLVHGEDHFSMAAGSIPNLPRGRNAHAQACTRCSRWPIRFNG
jgi:hypothetical protein